MGLPLLLTLLVDFTKSLEQGEFDQVTSSSRGSLARNDVANVQYRKAGRGIHTGFRFRIALKPVGCKDKINIEGAGLNLNKILAGNDLGGKSVIQAKT